MKWRKVRNPNSEIRSKRKGKEIHTVIESLNAWGGLWIRSAGLMLAQSVALMAVLLARDWVLRKRARAVIRYSLLSLVLVKLVLPPSLALPTGVGYWVSPAPRPGRMTAMPAPQYVPPALPLAPRVVGAADQLPMPSDAARPALAPEAPGMARAPGAGASPAPMAPPSVRLSWPRTCLLLWLAGVAALGIHVVRRSRVVSRLTLQAEDAPAEMQDVLNSCREQLRARQKVGLKLTGFPGSPAVCGLFRPVILIPGFLAEKLSAAQLKAVLLHEVGHVKRGDLWMNHLQTVLQVAYWYNPLLWVANAAMRRVREQAVDELVMVNIQPETHVYVDTLLEVAKATVQCSGLNLGLVGIAESSGGLRRRIERLITGRMPKSAKLGVAGAVAVLVVAGLALPMARGAAKAPAKEEVQRNAGSDPTETWALGERPGSEKLGLWEPCTNTILRTPDGGKSWRDVSPPGLRVALGSFFYDSERAWLASAAMMPSDTNLTIFRTSDGGNHWDSTTLNTFAVSCNYGDCEAWFSFPTPETGWLMVIPDHGANSSPGMLYRTADGGASWRLVTSTGGGETDDEKQDWGSGPKLSHGGEILFQSASTGWVYGGFMLSMTRDGGLTWWQVQSPPLPGGFQGGGLNPTGLPKFFPGGRDGILAAKCWPAPQSRNFDSGFLSIYTTHDGGLTWQPTKPLECDWGVWNFITVKKGWVWSFGIHYSNSGEPVGGFEGTLYRTDDGGSTWIPVKPGKGLPRYLTNGESVRQLHFVDDKHGRVLVEHGWVLGESRGRDHQQFLETSDGGEKWEPSASPKQDRASAFPFFIDEIRMFGVNNGWAKADKGFGPSRLLHTTNGGEDWQEVTPSSVPHRLWHFECLGPEMAWVTYFNEHAYFLLTTNGGKSWAPFEPLGDLSGDTHNYFLGGTSSRFFNARDGLITAEDHGAGSAYYTFFETHDGGFTWQIDTPPGTTPQSTHSGAGLSFYPPGTVVTATGDLEDNDNPEGFVRLSVSTNRGQSWRDLKLPLPERYREHWAGPLDPFFNDSNNGLLPVRVFERDTNGYPLNFAMIFYNTTNAGSTWAMTRGIVEGEDYLAVHFLSARDFFMYGQTNLYVTHDGANTWSTLGFRKTLDFHGVECRVSQIDFVDVLHGWLLASGEGVSFLYKTSDGGRTWKELPWKGLP